MIRAIQAAVLLFVTGSMLLTCSDEQPPAPPVIQAPDTSSHDIAWTTDVVGDAESTFHGLFAINDSIVYAVGTFLKRDSAGKLDLNPYNAARWDGKSWTALRIPVLVCGTNVTDPIELEAGFGFSEDRIHVFPGGMLVEKTDSGYHYDCNLQFILRAPFRTVFAYSNDDYYLIGDKGTVVHWDGTKFSREETGVQWETKDIYGNQDELWAVAGTPSDYKGGVLYKSRAGNWKIVDSLSDGGKRSVNSVWCDTKPYQESGFVILAGRGIWYRDTTWKRPPQEVTGGNLGLGNVYFDAVRGTARNDVFAVGDFDIVAHYNGKSWKFYDELFRYPSGGILASVAFTRHDIFFAGGDPDGKARILHGRRK